MAGKNTTFPEPKRPFKFYLGQSVMHVGTGGSYVITTLPDKAVIEESWEPAYGYRPKSGGPEIFRSQEKMEDGRFAKRES